MKDIKIKEIKGNTGSMGKAIGMARIVKDPNLSQKFEAGDILVANITSPDFVPLIRIAGAIVVDVGGILCHAAIIARELSKPCIVDTKIATSVLKNGDLIEVDATKGIITIINK
jgi:pyruvate,water dikinase